MKTVLDASRYLLPTATSAFYADRIYRLRKENKTHHGSRSDVKEHRTGFDDQLVGYVYLSPFQGAVLLDGLS